MKSLLVFALCGITYCLAVPACTPAELEKCNEGPPFPLGSEAEELDRVCRQTKCWLKVYDRCGTAVFGLKGYFPIKGYHKVVDDICPKSSPLRRKYLENVKCIREATRDFRSFTKECGIVDDGNRDDFCRIIPSGYKCAINSVTRTCGNDAGEVFEVAALPGLNPYDCPL